MQLRGNRATCLVCAPVAGARPRLVKGSSRPCVQADPCAATPCSRYTSSERATNAEYQREAFNDPGRVEALGQAQPEEVVERLREIASAVPDLGVHSRVLDVGSGTGALIPFLMERGVRDILASDLAPNMLAQISAKFPANSLGNDKAVRTWLGDVASLPSYQGPFDAVFFNSVFGNILDQRDALLQAALRLKPGGHVVLSHPLGSSWLNDLRAENPKMVPNALPAQTALADLIADLPLRMTGFRDEEHYYCAVLQVPEGYSFEGAPVLIGERVVTGFGRGSRQMGVPTANLAPESLFAGPLHGLPLGVYFGWAKVLGAQGADGAVHKTVLNIGRRPTIEDGEQRTIELHIMHGFSDDFYGANVRAALVGHIRPEMKFEGLGALVDRIKADIGVAKRQLDLGMHAETARDAFFEC